MKLVTDGTYWAIKRGWLLPTFYDFESCGLWWGRDSRWFFGCWTTKEKAEQQFKRLTA